MLEYGYYDSVSNDRTYTAEQFNRLLDGIVSDGVLPSVGEVFGMYVTGLDLEIDSGRAIFDNTWTYNDGLTVITMSNSHGVYDRIDELVLEINKLTRTNSFTIVEGTPASSPTRPALTKTSTVIQYSFASVYRSANETPTQANLVRRIGTAETPFASLSLSSNRITEYPSVSTEYENDVILVDGDGSPGAGSSPRKVTIANFRDHIFSPIVDDVRAQAIRRSYFRGKNLGTSFTNAHKNAISSGQFTDVFLGDYWIINGITWRVVDFDYFYGRGDTALAKHHVVIMPDTSLYNAQFHNSRTTDPGYLGMTLRNTGLNSARTAVQNAFTNANVVTHRDMLFGTGTTRSWTNCTVEIPTIQMITGGRNDFSPHSITGPAYPPSIGNSQFAAMQLAPRLQNLASYWLRNVNSTTTIHTQQYNGQINTSYADDVTGIRPFFLLGNNA